MKSEAGLGLAVHWVQQALVLAYENNCPLKPVKVGRQTLKWTRGLESLRKEMRRLFNKCRSDKNTHSWDLFREAQRTYRKEVRKASRGTLRVFCSSIKDLPRSARLHRALSRDPKIKLGSLVTPSGSRMQSEGETLELLLTTHFPNSVSDGDVRGDLLTYALRPCLPGTVHGFSRVTSLSRRLSSSHTTSCAAYLPSLAKEAHRFTPNTTAVWGPF